MKVGIVTVYNSHNCGSYLQAAALCEYVKTLGYDARFIINKIHPKSSPWYKILLATKYFIKGNSMKACRIVSGSIRFLKARKNFSYYSSCKEADICIYGSDTIWNLNSAHLKSQWQFYFGDSYNGKKIAYAPSIGETAVETITDNPALCSCIRDFSSLSVRDENTYKVVSTVLGQDAEITYVVDPTMLMPKTFYESIASECKDENFILFYYFGIPDKSYMDEIKSFAKKNGKKLICFGDNIEDVDKRLPFSPLEMMGYYSKADLVITNTFHGNVFSLIFNKPFVNIDAGKAKVDDLLKSFNLSERTIREAKDFSEVAIKQIDYNNINLLLEQKKKASCEYLENALKKCEGEYTDAR